MMNELIFAAAMLAPAQPGPASDATPTGHAVSHRDALYEQIEVMRALLIRNLGVSAPVQAPLTTLTMTEPVQPPSAFENLNGAFQHYSGQSPIRQFGTSIEPAVEGTYLANYGVAFAVTLPKTGRDPRPGSAEPKDSPTLSEWDREQRRLRGESPPEKSRASPSHPPVGDVVLKLLAENGKHFTSLKDDERVTIAVTIRGSIPRPPTATTLEPFRPGGTVRFGTGTLSSLPEPQSSRDYQLLGELHLKQGQPQQAIEAYQKAVALSYNEAKESPDRAGALDRLREALAKLAQAQLAAGKFEEARKAMETASRLDVSKSTTANPASKPAAVNLPARLTISASKKLLDEIGSGKIGMDDFRKEVTVEYVAEEKSSGR